MTKLRHVFGHADEKTLLQMENCLAVEENAIGALMADNHLGYSMPIGGVVAYENHISPSGVGFDIGCGNLYVETDVAVGDVQVPAVMDEIAKVISFGVGRANNEPVADHPVFDQIADLGERVGNQSLLGKARQQLGTVGAGNHYVDLFANRATGKLGVGVHFGSRGVGHTIASMFMALAKNGQLHSMLGVEDMMAMPLVFQRGTAAAVDYEEAMNVGLDFAIAGREWVVNRIVQGILQAKVTDTVHNNHNYAARETHDGRDMFVHRKGATPAFPGQRGFVGASMGEDALLVQGVENYNAEEMALWSTVHGAGRAMSRMAASKGTFEWTCPYVGCGRKFAARPNGNQEPLPKNLKCPGNDEIHRGTAGPALVKTQLTPGINYRDVQDQLRSQGIYVIGGAADEAPGSYKRLDEVIQYHVNSETIGITARLQVLGVVMAGPKTHDPYKD